MERLFRSVTIKINEKIYVKDPVSSDLGKRIINQSIIMINDLGFERFTFKKLGQAIGSNESSIYRYFENKHKLLLYLTSWYWAWLEYQLVFATNSIANSSEKLKKAIEIVTRPTVEDTAFSHINEVLLSNIVINEYSKSYLTKEIDKENKEGYFEIYKRMIERYKEMISVVDSEYKYPSSLASTILEGSLQQYFLKDHFPSLTDCHEKGDTTKYLTDLVFNTLKAKQNG
ncbi:TetR/AcrR family transcriptional regulator [Arenibacter aquaticus]|uniref:TetR/AcrR family transcriptional regulator n=1 Tax=Arenibacter aquaticus TaxID=2489054 RepID=A0A3S0AEP1_9FLAO|nr:TetR/AcrR family transcriptional regulator [Arenibacter aquaticus]RTE53841.1 TetR/AcrR family transcriptional regulator [Arenibacter aquaticus]